MLDLARLAGQVEEMAGECRQQMHARSLKAGEALAALKEYDRCPDEWLDKINSDDRHFFVAFPQEKMLDVHPLPEPVFPHTVAAVDGSQIDVDTHEIALCYLLNVGRVVIHYGTKDAPFMDSLPRLCFKEEELYRQWEGESLLVQGDRVAEMRCAMEARQLREMVLEHSKIDVPIVALVDGRLVSWDRLGTARKDPAAFTAVHFAEIFKSGHSAGFPVAGYVSGSRTSLVVNTLRAKYCVKPVMNCSGCEHKNDRTALCRLMEGVRDTSLFSAVLAPGERTCCFYGGINSLSAQKAPKYRIGFFYINVGSEIARVEIPDYVVENGALLNLLHRVVYDQTQKGMGYPIALQEAHHFAVVKAEDREAFYHLLGRQFVRYGLPLRVTNKKIGKMSRIF